MIDKKADAKRYKSILWSFLGVGFIHLFMYGCARSNEEAVARVILAIATKSQFAQSINVSPNPTAGASPTASASPTLPTQISCDDDVYEIAGGTFAMTPKVVGGSTVTLSFAASLDVKGPGLNGTTTSSTAQAVNCSFIGTLGVDSTNLIVKGPLTLTTCSSYECIIFGKKVKCEDLKAAFKDLACS
jgi:hypothetical protein